MTSHAPTSPTSGAVLGIVLGVLAAQAVPVAGRQVEQSRVVSTRRAMPTWLGGALSFHVAPQVRFRAGALMGDASALLGGARQEPSRLEGQMAATFGLPALSNLRLETEAGAFRTRGGPDIRTHGLEGAVRLMRQDAGGMIWIGGSLASSWGDATSRRARTLTGGIWKTLGRSGVGLSLRGVEYDEEVVFGRDTTYEVLGFPFRSSRTEQIVYDHYYVDAELLASHRLGPVALHVEWGGRLTRRSVQEPRSWVRGGLEIPMVRNVTLQIAAGQRPNLPEYRIQSGSFATVGIQFELGRGAWQDPPLVADPPPPDQPGAELKALPERDRWELVVRNVPGTSVEIMGDPTNWEAVPLDAVAHDTWRTVLRLSPGTYRINIRVDGGPWSELPGYPTARDEFGGVVGVIVVGQ